MRENSAYLGKCRREIRGAVGPGIYSGYRRAGEGPISVQAFQFVAVQVGLIALRESDRPVIRGGAIGSTWAFGA